MKGRDEGVGLQELYLASYARLVKVVGAVTGDLHEAEDAVMDALSRGRNLPIVQTAPRRPAA